MFQFSFTPIYFCRVNKTLEKYHNCCCYNAQGSDTDFGGEHQVVCFIHDFVINTILAIFSLQYIWIASVVSILGLSINFGKHGYFTMFHYTYLQILKLKWLNRIWTIKIWHVFCIVLMIVQLILSIIWTSNYFSSFDLKNWYQEMSRLKAKFESLQRSQRYLPPPSSYTYTCSLLLHGCLLYVKHVHDFSRKQG
jgi:hypothetical protein